MVAGRLRDAEVGTLSFSEGTDGNPTKNVISEQGVYRLIICIQTSQSRFRFRTGLQMKCCRRSAEPAQSPPLQRPPHPAALIKDANRSIELILTRIPTCLIPSSNRSSPKSWSRRDQIPPPSVKMNWTISEIIGPLGASAQQVGKWIKDLGLVENEHFRSGRKRAFSH
jgi:hypothetical protein